MQRSIDFRLTHKHGDILNCWWPCYFTKMHVTLWIKWNNHYYLPVLIVVFIRTLATHFWMQPLTLNTYFSKIRLFQLEQHYIYRWYTTEAPFTGRYNSMHVVYNSSPIWLRNDDFATGWICSNFYAVFSVNRYSYCVVIAQVYRSKARIKWIPLCFRELQAKNYVTDNKFVTLWLNLKGSAEI